MKFLTILFGFLGLLAILTISNAADINCKKGCRENIVSCGYDEQRDCHRPFATECLLKEAVCKEGWKYQSVRVKECTSAFDFCQEFYDIRDQRLKEQFGI